MNDLRLHFVLGATQSFQGCGKNCEKTKKERVSFLLFRGQQLASPETYFWLVYKYHLILHGAPIHQCYRTIYMLMTEPNDANIRLMYASIAKLHFQLNSE